MSKEAIAFDRLQEQLQRRAFSAPLRSRLQVNAALCGAQTFFKVNMLEGETANDNPPPPSSEGDWSWYDLAGEERLKRYFHFIAVPAVMVLALVGGTLLARLIGTRGFTIAYLLALCPLVALAMELFPTVRPTGTMRRRLLRRTALCLIVTIVYTVALATFGLLPND